MIRSGAASFNKLLDLSLLSLYMHLMLCKPASLRLPALYSNLSSQGSRLCSIHAGQIALNPFRWGVGGTALSWPRFHVHGGKNIHPALPPPNLPAGETPQKCYQGAQQQSGKALAGPAVPLCSRDANATSCLSSTLLSQQITPGAAAKCNMINALFSS